MRAPSGDPRPSEAPIIKDFDPCGGLFRHFPFSPCVHGVRRPTRYRIGTKLGLETIFIVRADVLRPIPACAVGAVKLRCIASDRWLVLDVPTPLWFPPRSSVNYASLSVTIILSRGQHNIIIITESFSFRFFFFVESCASCDAIRFRRFCRNVPAVYPALWTFARVEGVEQGQRTLDPLFRKDFHEELVVPAGHSALPSDALFSRLTVQEADRQRRGQERWSAMRR